MPTWCSAGAAAGGAKFSFEFGSLHELLKFGSDVQSFKRFKRKSPEQETETDPPHLFINWLITDIPVLSVEAHETKRNINSCLGLTALSFHLASGSFEKFHPDADGFW